MVDAIEYRPTHLSVAEFEALPMEDDYKWELSATLLIREPPPGPRHGFVGARLAHRLQSWVEAGGGGAVLIETSFVLSHDPPIVRAPDLAWVERTDASPMDAPTWRGAPDLAVEILSPWDRRRAVREKVGQYLTAGVRLVWIVDPRAATVEVHDAAGSRMFRADDALDGDDVLRGLVLPLRSLFGA